MHTVFVKLRANGRNNPQQWCELLANNVASLCTGLYRGNSLKFRYQASANVAITTMVTS